MDETVPSDPVELLRACGLPIANALSVPIELDVVTYGFVFGSYAERNPTRDVGMRLDPPQVNYFLPTRGCEWPKAGTRPPYTFAHDNPLLVVDERNVWLHHPHEPFTKGMHMVRMDPLEAFPVPGAFKQLHVMAEINRAAYAILAHAYQCLREDTGQAIDLAQVSIRYSSSRSREPGVRGVSMVAGRWNGSTFNQIAVPQALSTVWPEVVDWWSANRYAWAQKHMVSV